MSELDLKKELFRELAFSLFGNAIGYKKDGAFFAKNMYFVNDETGLFFLFTRKTDEIAGYDLSKPVLFCIFKEEDVVAEFIEIRLEGSLTPIETGGADWENGLSRFKFKSPFIGNISWMDNPANYLMYTMKPEKITYQKLKDERTGKQPLVFYRQEGGF